MNPSKAEKKKEKNLEAKQEKLSGLLKEMGRVLVAFSGGVDSTFLLHASREVLGEKNVLAVTAVSEIMPKREAETAVLMAQNIGVEHLMMESHEMQDPRFTDNPHDKCYRCKKARYRSLVALATSRGFPFVADGENVDDRKDFRPGSLAARELGIRSVLSESGFTKADIRNLSKRFGLLTWNKPSSACLASRIPYQQHITPEKLRQVDQGEVYLMGLGIAAQVRVRHHGDTARIEVPPENIPAFLDHPVRKRVADYFKSIGFDFVALDLEGYSLGSLNRALAQNRDRGVDG